MNFIGLYKLGATYRAQDLTYPDFIRNYTNEIERDQAIRDAMLIAQANALRERQEQTNYGEQAMPSSDRDNPRRWRVVEVTVLEGLN